MMELKNSKTVKLPTVDGKERYAVSGFIDAVQMLDNGQWRDIRPILVRDADGFHIEGAPYAINITADGDRRIYPDRTDLSKWIYLPAPALVRSLPKRIEENKIVTSAPKFDVSYQFTNTGIQFQLLIKEPIPFDRVTFDVDTKGFDFLQLLKSKTGLGIPKPRLTEQNGLESKERQLEWSYKAGQLELGFDLTGLKFPILLRNTTIDVQVNVGANDGRRYTGTGGFANNGANGYIGYSTNAVYLHLHHFDFWTGLTISGTVNTAYIRKYATAITNRSHVLAISVVNSGTPVAPTTAGEYDAASLYGSVAWTDIWTASQWNQSPSIVSLIQYLVDTYGLSNATVGVYLKDNSPEEGLNRYDTVNFQETAGYGANFYVIFTPPVTGHPYSSRVQGVQGMRTWGGI